MAHNDYIACRITFDGRCFEYFLASIIKPFLIEFRSNSFHAKSSPMNIFEKVNLFTCSSRLSKYLSQPHTLQTLSRSDPAPNSVAPFPTSPRSLMLGPVNRGLRQRFFLFTRFMLELFSRLLEHHLLSMKNKHYNSPNTGTWPILKGS